MEQIEFRAVIKFLTKQGKPPKTIMNEMGAVYGVQCPSKTMIYKWNGLFKQGRESIEDDSRPGRPAEVTTPDIVEKIEKLILEDARLKKKTAFCNSRSIRYNHFEDPTRSSWHVKSQCKMGAKNAHAASQATKNRSVKALFGAV